MPSYKPKLLGIAASLRNARWGLANRQLIEELISQPDKQALYGFLERESELHLDNFLKAGRSEGKNFIQIYAGLARRRGCGGLSNSEVALAAALWSAYQKGAEISHLSLAEFFGASARCRHAHELKQKLMDADGILVSGPVYFGDRGSLAESLVNFVATDRELLEALSGRLYGGIAVGAKRNGGQETLLIYQMLDMLNLGMLGVGNDSDTTAQYGGTGHAGDVGTMHKDEYGIETSMGVGRRMAEVLAHLTSGYSLSQAPRALFLILQDAHGLGARLVSEFLDRLGSKVKSTVLNLADSNIRRCIACDVCPTHIDLDRTYRCIIKSTGDPFADVHASLLDPDILIPVVVSLRDRVNTFSNYQKFVERSRYLRRGDYVWSDSLTVPVTLTEISGCDSYPLRQMTSFLRHNTVMCKPLVGYLRRSRVENLEELIGSLDRAVDMAGKLAGGKSMDALSTHRQYKPIGYILSAEKEREDEHLQRRAAALGDRISRKAEDAQNRVARVKKASP